MDAKNSPLALLAQTCSQIGSDSSNGVKALLSADKQKAQGGKMENAKSPTAAQKLIMDSSRNTNSSSPGSTKSPPLPKNGLNKSASVDSNNNSGDQVKLAFKPYENEVLAGKAYKSGNSGRRSAETHQSYDQRSEKCLSPPSTTGNDSVSGAGERKCPSNRSSSDENRNSSNHASASPYGQHTSQQSSPILRPGLESLPTDYSAYKLPQLSSPYGNGAPLGFPPGMDPQELLMNPAFRPPYATGYPSSVPPPSAAAASMMGYHPALSPYFGFGAAAAAAAAASMKPQAGAPGAPGSAECKDPNCTGCTYSAAAQHHHHQQMMYNNMAMAAIQSNYQMQGQQRPMQCNWISGDSYCGKKCNSSEELMHHLKTHTAGLSDPTAAAAALIQAQLQPNHAALGLPPPGSLYPPHSSSGMPSHRGYRTPPPLSPMSAAAAMRYHPYAAAAAAAVAAQGGKGGSPLPPLPPSSYASFNPAMFSPYAYSPYALYGQRSAIHP